MFFCWENSCCTFSRHQTRVQQWCQCICDISEHLCFKKMGSIILIALTAHHTPSIICSGTSWLNMGFSADRNLLFWEFPYPLKWKRASSLNTTCVISHSPAYSPWRYQFTKFTYRRNCILRMCPTKHVLLERDTAATTTTVLTCSFRLRMCVWVCGRAAEWATSYRISHRKRSNKQCLTKWCPYCLPIFPVLLCALHAPFACMCFGSTC